MSPLRSASGRVFRRYGRNFNNREQTSPRVCGRGETSIPVTLERLVGRNPCTSKCAVLATPRAE